MSSLLCAGLQMSVSAAFTVAFLLRPLRGTRGARAGNATGWKHGAQQHSRWPRIGDTRGTNDFKEQKKNNNNK